MLLKKTSCTYNENLLKSVPRLVFDDDGPVLSDPPCRPQPRLEPGQYWLTSHYNLFDLTNYRWPVIIIIIAVISETPVLLFFFKSFPARLSFVSNKNFDSFFIRPLFSLSLSRSYTHTLSVSHPPTHTFPWFSISYTKSHSQTHTNVKKAQLDMTTYTQSGIGAHSPKVTYIGSDLVFRT